MPKGTLLWRVKFQKDTKSEFQQSGAEVFVKTAAPFSFLEKIAESVLVKVELSLAALNVEPLDDL